MEKTNLLNRPSLNVDNLLLSTISMRISSSPDERLSFLNKPNEFLKEDDIKFNNANLIRQNLPLRTSEVTFTGIIFVAMAAVVVGAAIAFGVVYWATNLVSGIGYNLHSNHTYDDFTNIC